MFVLCMRIFRKSERICLEIQTPSITLNELNTSMQLHVYIDYMFMFYLYNMNFIIWDYYCLNYMFSYKQCRTVMDKLLSKLSPFIMSDDNAVIYLNKKQRSYAYMYNSTKLQFISTLNGKNRLIELKPPSLKVFVHHLQFEYVIHFTLAQAIKVAKSVDVVSEWKLKDILSKFISIVYYNGSSKLVKVGFNYKAFDDVSEKEWMELLKGIDVFDVTKNKKKNDEHVKGSVVDIGQPCLVIKWVDENENKEMVECVDNVFKLFRKMVKCDNINYWPVLCSEVLNGKENGSNNQKDKTMKGMGMIIRRNTCHIKSNMMLSKKNKRKSSYIV